MSAGQGSQTQFTGRWRQSPGKAGPHKVFRKKGSDKNIPILSNIFIFILRSGPKMILLRAAVGPRATRLRPLV